MDCAAVRIDFLWPESVIKRNSSDFEEIFTSYFNTVDKNLLLECMSNNDIESNEKNVNAAIEYREEGNRFYKSQDYEKALKFYNKSISKAPRESAAFGLAVANRSAVFFDLKNYTECIEDINLVTRSEYPKNLYYKIFLRQSKCYLKLHLNAEVTDALTKVQKSINKQKGILSKTQISFIANEITKIQNQMEQQIERKLDSANNAVCIPSLTNGENEHFLNASKAVSIKSTKRLGRHVVANKDIRKGDVLFVERPYASVPTLINSNSCAFCLRTAENYIPCINCCGYNYCSDNCRQKCWDSTHRWECFAIRSNLILDSQHRLCLNILLKASYTGFKSTIEDDSVYGNKDNNYPFVCKLITHNNKLCEKDITLFMRVAVWLTLYLKHFTDYFDWLYIQQNRPVGSREDLCNIIGGYILKHLLQIKLNCMYMIKTNIRLVDGMIDLISNETDIGLMVSTSLLNHSCDSNTVFSFHEGLLVLKASVNIKQGTEITMNYLGIGYAEMNTEARQTILKRHYYFTCKCIACTDPKFKYLITPLLCHQCNGKVYMSGNSFVEKCSDCQKNLNLMEYVKIEREIEQLYGQFQLFNNLNHLDLIYSLMKTIYHKYNANFRIYYINYISYYRAKGDIKKCVNAAKFLCELTENIYPDTSLLFVADHLTYFATTLVHCISAKKQKFKNYKKLKEELNVIIEKSSKMLSYHMCSRGVIKFVTHASNSLNLEEVDLESLIFKC